MKSTPELAAAIAALVPEDGNRSFSDWGITVVRQSHPSERPLQGVLSASICLVAQGAKRVFLDGNSFDYDEDHLIVSSVDVPVSYQLTRASAETPFLCLRMTLDPVRIAPLVSKVFQSGLPSRVPTVSIGVTATDPSILDVACRLVRSVSDTKDGGLLTDLAYQELLIRLLRSSLGTRIAQIAVSDSAAVGIAKAIEWLRANFALGVKIDDLAALAHMSVSSFHQHFREVTAQSPLQFQKALRLQEARNLMLTGAADAGGAAAQVGYISPSQFSREYTRYFGQSPTRDVASMKEQLVTTGL